MATIDGTPNDDVLGGTAGDDTIHGFAGKDTIFGGDGNDVLDGGPEPISRGTVIVQADFLYGGNGNDSLTGSTLDVLDGGTGDDTLRLTGAGFTAQGVAYAFGGDGNDTITTRLSNAVIDAGAGADEISAAFLFGFISEGGPLDAGDIRVTTGSGPDSIAVQGKVTVTDFTVTGAEADRYDLSAYGSNDPFALNQLIVYQNGADTVVRSIGTSQLFINSLNPRGFTIDLHLQNVAASSLTAANFSGFSPGVLWQVGTEAADTLPGTSGADKIHGFGGDDVISGGGGDDVIVGGLGVDTVTGGAGADQFLFTMDYNSSGGGTGDIAAGDSIGDFETGIDRIGLFGRISSNSVISSRVSLTDTGGGHTSVNLFVPGALTQSIDVVGAVAPSDVTASGTHVGIGFAGTSGPDTINGTAFADDISGGHGDDLLSGLAGDDLLLGGQGADILFGGAGGDVFFYTAVSDSIAGATDTISDFERGVDKIDLINLHTSSTLALVQQDGGGTVLFANFGGAAFQLFISGAALDGTDMLALSADTQIVRNNSDGTAIGTDGHDHLFGGNGADVLSAGGAADELRGGAGNDTLIGGFQADVLYGDAGADTFKYVAVLDSVAGADDLIADFVSGLDRIDLSSVNATSIAIVDNGGNSIIFANTSGGQLLIGSIGTVQGNDILAGVGVTIQGGAASSQLVGGNLNDTLFGEGGDDLLQGSNGADVLFGGTGFDTFRYIAAADSLSSAPDLIADFQTGIDKIDLTGTGVTSVGIASNIVFAAGPGGIAMQIGVLSAVALSDIVIGSPGPVPLFAGDAAHDAVAGGLF